MRVSPAHRVTRESHALHQVVSTGLHLQPLPRHPLLSCHSCLMIHCSCVTCQTGRSGPASWWLLGWSGRVTKARVGSSSWLGVLSRSRTGAGCWWWWSWCCCSECSSPGHGVKRRVEWRCSSNTSYNTQMIIRWTLIAISWKMLFYVSSRRELCYCDMWWYHRVQHGSLFIVELS